MMSELMVTDYYSRIGSTTQAKLIPRTKTEEEKKYQGYANSISQGMQALVSAQSPSDVQNAIATLKVAMQGQITGATSVALGVSEYTPGEPFQVIADIDGVRTRFTIDDDASTKRATIGLIDVGGAHNYHRTANDYRYNFNPLQGVDVDFRGDAAVFQPVKKEE